MNVPSNYHHHEKYRPVSHTGYRASAAELQILRQAFGNLFTHKRSPNVITEFQVSFSFARQWRNYNWEVLVIKNYSIYILASIQNKLEGSWVHQASYFTVIWIFFVSPPGQFGAWCSGFVSSSRAFFLANVGLGRDQNPIISNPDEG